MVHVGDPSEAPSALADGEWSARARQRVTQWQERAYGELAVRSGLGKRPLLMFHQLTDAIERPDLSSMREALPEGSISDEEWQGAATWLEAYLEENQDDELPTPFTERWLQSTYNFHRAAAERVIQDTQWPLPYRPRMATIPSGDFNARSRRIDGTDEVAVLFDHTLLTYVHRFALVVAACFPDDWWEIQWTPSLGSVDIGVDADRAEGMFADLIINYVLHGYVEEGPPPLTWRTKSIAVRAAASMRQWLVSHELAHLQLGHLGQSHADLDASERHQREYAADRVGASISAAATDGSDVVTCWIADLTLAAFQYLHRAVWYLATGLRQEMPASLSHPQPGWRREHLLENITGDLWDVGKHEDSNRLGQRTIDGATRLEELWLAAADRLTRLREVDSQPAQLWTPLLQTKERPS